VIGILLLLLQAVPPPTVPTEVVAPAVETPAPAAVEPWDRSFADGLREIRRLTDDGKTDDAVLVAERLVASNALARRVDDWSARDGWRAQSARALGSIGDSLELLGPPAAIRAEAYFASAVALRTAGDRAPEGEERDLRREQAHLAFESARLLAGPGELRLDATYGQGSLALARAEEIRATIPEISGQPPAPPPPPAATAPGAKPAEPPDPVQLARAAYLAARERFVERLRMSWRDADTQANVELIQRRLRELDAIEKKREEEKKDKEEQEKQEDEKKQDQEQKPDSKPDEKKDGDEKDEPKSEEPPEDPKDPTPEDQPKDEPKPDEAPKEPPKPMDPKDAPKMSKEEMLQLLERLEKIEEVQKELQEKLKRARKVSVEKDW